MALLVRRLQFFFFKRNLDFLRIRLKDVYTHFILSFLLFFVLLLQHNGCFRSGNSGSLDHVRVLVRPQDAPHQQWTLRVGDGVPPLGLRGLLRGQSQGVPHRREMSRVELLRVRLDANRALDDDLLRHHPGVQLQSHS